MRCYSWYKFAIISKLQKSEVKTKEEEIKMENEVQDSILASTSKISEKKKKVKVLQKTADDSKLLDEDYDDEDEYSDDENSDEDSNMSGIEAEEVMLECT